jgi:hypothetical protein
MSSSKSKEILASVRARPANTDGETGPQNPASVVLPVGMQGNARDDSFERYIEEVQRKRDEFRAKRAAEAAGVTEADQAEVQVSADEEDEAQ